MKPQIIAISLLTLGISACSEQEKPTQDSASTSQVAEQIHVTQNSAKQTKETLPPSDTSRSSLGWNGTYSGVIPCASGEGIDTIITLKPDNSYVLETHYQGDNTEAKKIFTEAGLFEWNNEGNKISLMGNASRKANPQQLLVGENQLLMLDMKGNQITSSLAELYRLAKQGHQKDTVDVSSIHMILPQDMKSYDQQMGEFVQVGGDDPFDKTKMVKTSIDQDVTARQLAQTVAQLISPYKKAGEVKYYELKDSTAYVMLEMDEDGWAGVSVIIGQIRPLVELNLLQYPEIDKVKFGRLPEQT